MSKASEMLDPLPVPAFLFDAQRQRFIASNESFQIMLHYSEEEILKLDWRRLVVPEEVSIGERAIESGAMARPVRWRFRRKDGEVIKVIIVNRRINFTADDGSVYDAFFTLVVDRGDLPIPASAAFPER